MVLYKYCKHWIVLFIVQLKGFLFYTIIRFVIFPVHTLACIQLLHKVEELKLNLQAHLSKVS